VLVGLSKHIIMVAKHVIQPSILRYQEGWIIVYLFLGVGARVVLITLLACGAMCHAAKALGGEEQAVDDLARPLALVSVLFFIT
jgi:hypothetical protein